MRWAKTGLLTNLRMMNIQKVNQKENIFCNSGIWRCDSKYQYFKSLIRIRLSNVIFFKKPFKVVNLWTNKFPDIHLFSTH